MTYPQLSLVAALLDRSGSMHSIADDTRGGFDLFITRERKTDGRTVVTLAQVPVVCPTVQFDLGTDESSRLRVRVP